MRGQIRVQAVQRPDCARRLALGFEHSARPESALTVGLAIVHSRIRKVRLGVYDALELSSGRVEEMKTVPHCEDKPFSAPNGEATWPLGRGKRLCAACSRFVAMNCLCVDIHPPETLGLRIPARPFAEKCSSFDDTLNVDHHLLPSSRSLLKVVFAWAKFAEKIFGKSIQKLAHPTDLRKSLLIT